MSVTDSTLYSQPFFKWEFAEPELHQDFGLSIDSLFPEWPQDSLVMRESFLQPLLFSVKNDALMPHAASSVPVWVFAAIVAVVSLLLLYYRVRKFRFAHALAALFNRRMLRRLTRVANLSPLRLFPIGVLLSAMLSLCLYRAVDCNIDVYVVPLFALLMMIVYVARWLLLRLLGVVFEEQNTIMVCITSSYMYHLVLTTFLAPLLFLMFYLNGGSVGVLRIVGIAVVVFLFARLMREMMIFFSMRQSRNFNLFFYLCIVELAPLMILVKWFFEQ